ncbi:MAG: hypothetical protein ACK5JH_16050 [Anaerocolumna sp.]
MEEIDHLVEILNKAGEMAKELNIKVGYHNHANEFVKIEVLTFLSGRKKSDNSINILIKLFADHIGYEYT